MTLFRDFYFTIFNFTNSISRFSLDLIVINLLSTLFFSPILAFNTLSATYKEDPTSTTFL
jgi:hypothetical protein